MPIHESSHKAEATATDELRTSSQPTSSLLDNRPQTAAQHSARQAIATSAQQTTATAVSASAASKIRPDLQAISAHLAQHLKVQELVNFSKVNKTLNRNAREVLYNSHAETLPYQSNVAAAAIRDHAAAKEVFEQVRKAVNVAYRMVCEYLAGSPLNYKKYGISDRRWEDFVNKLNAYQRWQAFRQTNPTGEQVKEYARTHGGQMTPATAVGYIVEDISTYILSQWSNELTFQDTKVMGNGTRPDVTAKTSPHNEQVLVDITSDIGHILDKPKEGKEEETNWLQHPHVAEVLFPRIDFSNPGRMNMQLSEAELAAITEKTAQKQVDLELKRYQDFLKHRELYYNGIQKELAAYAKLAVEGTLPLRRLNQLKANPNLEVEMDVDSGREVPKVAVKPYSQSSQKRTYNTDIYTSPPVVGRPLRLGEDVEMEACITAEEFADKAVEHLTKKRKPATKE